LRREIAATESERAALARRFDLVALDRLEAAVELVRRADEEIVLHAAFAADFVQSCIVTLDPVGGTLSASFVLRYGAPEAEAAETDPQEDWVYEPLVGEAIDIGEAVAQEFSLALPPFPRGPEAGLDAASEPPGDGGPFAVLSSPGEPEQR